MSKNKIQVDAPFRVGSVGLISSIGDDGLLPVVAIADGEDSMSVVPLSPAVPNATEWDLVLPVDILGYEAIAEVWNYGSILPEQCGTVVAELPPESLAALQLLARAALSGGEVPSGLSVGPPVLDESDPRLLFQDAEAEAAHAFWEPALSLAGAATFGEFLRHRRAELAVEPDELEEVTGRHGWLNEIEQDAVDLREALPVPALVAMLRRLQVGASARLRAIARSTLEASNPQFARGQASRNEPVVDADAYLDEVFEALREEDQ